MMEMDGGTTGRVMTLEACPITTTWTVTEAMPASTASSTSKRSLRWGVGKDTAWARTTPDTTTVVLATSLPKFRPTRVTDRPEVGTAAGTAPVIDGG